MPEQFKAVPNYKLFSDGASMVKIVKQQEVKETEKELEIVYADQNYVIAKSSDAEYSVYQYSANYTSITPYEDRELRTTPVLGGSGMRTLERAFAVLIQYIYRDYDEMRTRFSKLDAILSRLHNDISDYVDCDTRV